MDAAQAKQLGGPTREALELYKKVKQHVDGFKTDLVLPEIVVIGKQSAGKSSVLTKLLSGAVSFPSSQGTCTRCPTVVYSRFSEGKQRCRFSLRYRWDDKTNKQLPEIRTETQDEHDFDMADWGKIPKTIKNLQKKLLNGKEFTLNEVIVHVEGSEFPDLDIKDLPGLISNGNAKDITKVRSMVSESISKRNTMIMVCVPCTDDIDNQEALQIASEVDPDGERTLGVLTKPDRVENGADDDVVLLLKNEHPKAKLQNGWFVVRCPSPEEGGGEFNNSRANEAELHFFDSHEIGQRMKAVALNECGTQGLLDWISQKIAEEIHGQVPVLLPQVEKLCEKSQKELVLMCNDVTGSNVHDFILNALVELDRQASLQIRCEGSASRDHWQSVKAGLEKFTEELADTRPHFGSVGKDVKGPSWTLDAVEGLVKHTQGRELFACTDTTSAVNKIIRRSLTLWPEKVEDALVDILDKVVVFFDKLVDDMNTYERFRNDLKKHLRQLAYKQNNEMKTKADELLQAHGCTKDADQRFLTMNQSELQKLRRHHLYLLNTMGKTWKARLLPWMARCLLCSILVLLGMFMSRFLEALVTGELHSGGVSVLWSLGSGQIMTYQKTCTLSAIMASIAWQIETNVLEYFGVVSKTPLALEVMAQSMAYWELCSKRFGDTMCTLFDHTMLHAFAGTLVFSLRQSMGVGELNPNDLMNMVLSEGDIQKRRNFERRLQQEIETRDSIKSYMERNGNPINMLISSTIKDATGGSNGCSQE